nr:putative ribonuclease H-like domain-containing protein [Tanacetum cinerariifolium]
SDSEVAPCSKSCSKAYATLQSHYDKLTVTFKKSQFDVMSYKSSLESVEARLVVYQQNKNVFEEGIKMLKLDVMLRDNALVELRKKFEAAEKERDELKLTLENFQTSSKSLSKLLANQITDKTGLGYDNQVFNSTMFDSDELNSSESDVSVPTSPVHDRYKSVRLSLLSLIVEPSTTKPTKDKSQSNRPSAHIIEDWVSDSKDESEVEYPQQTVNLRKDILKSRVHRHSWNKKTCFVCKSVNHLIKDYDYYEKKMVQKPVWNHAIRVNHHNSARMTHPYSKKHVVPTAVLTSMLWINLHIKEEDTECIVMCSDFKLPDENHMLLSVPGENNMYNLDLKNIVPLGDLTCLFAKATLDESNLWHRRLGHINFKTMNKLVKVLVDVAALRELCLALLTNTLPEFVITVVGTKFLLGEGKFDRKVDEGFLVGYSVSSKAFRVFNSRTRIVQETLHIAFLENQPNVVGSGPTWLFDIDTLTQSMNYQPVVVENQPNSSACIQENHDAYVDDAFADKENESEVHVSLSSSDKTKKHDEMAKREAKGKSLVDFARVTAVGPNLTNSTNSFNAAGPSDNVVSLNFEIGRKYSFVDPSHYPDDPYMPTLEDIVYLDDEEDVGAEADFSNLETRFKDTDYPDKVYKVVKALYGTHQAPRAWYETLANYLMENGFQRGKIDQTLFIKKQKDKFQMSLMGELTLFWGLQVKEKDNGIFINQDKYVAKILRKFGLTDGKSASTPIDTKKPLLKDPDGEDVDVHIYSSMIGSLMYLTLSKPDIMFVVCACARFYVTLKVSHLHAVKRIFRYLKGKPHLGLWYLKDYPFNLVAYSNSDYAGASLERKSTTGGCQFLGCRLISWQCKKQTIVATSSTEAKYVATASCCAQKSNDVVRLQALIDRKKVIITDDTIRQTLCLDDAAGVDCLSNEEIFAELARMGYEKSSIKLTFYKAFFSAQWNMVRNVDSSSKFLMYPQFLQLMINAQVDDLSAQITKYTSPALTQKVFANMRRTEDEDDDNEVSTKPTPPSPTPATTPPSPTQEDIPSPPQAQTAQPSSPPPQQPSQTTDISMTFLNTLLETCTTLTKQVANLEQDKIAQAIEIKKLKQRVMRLEKKRKFNCSGLKRLRKVGTTQRVKSLADIVMDGQEDASKQGGITEEDIDADASTPRRRRGVVIQDPKETAIGSVIMHSKVKSKDKGKGILIEDPKPLKRQAQIEQDEAFARQLKAELNANINWDDVIEQVKRKEKQDNTVMRYQALKRKPITEAQARKNMMIYLKNMAGFKIDFFKRMTYNDIRPIFKKHYNLNQAFLERVKEEVTGPKEEGNKRKANDDADVYTEATPFASKIPIVDYQIHHENNKPYYKIIRADGTQTLFISFITLLKNFDREDLEMLWKLVQERFQSSEPKNFLDDFLKNEADMD